jgi:hypothetical protein
MKNILRGLNKMRNEKINTPTYILARERKGGKLTCEGAKAEKVLADNIFELEDAAKKRRVCHGTGSRYKE